ncbi:SDR family NAD(P)-dependent oxidoreductase [Parvibaculum sp.]|uniref:SDR family NAD(P)-dependent oxidoreductase n=1 Tax=Parvibaculum sp. TaxID=2024848 RepID=UPI002B8EF573|nr:SDR family NAD(P)-dependent oxidoreductase [Parvibaculum sp.]HUD52591.1 SDR family NAD(P)-dependent oxidoreductase [Parvibaculum sp.]
MKRQTAIVLGVGPENGLGATLSRQVAEEGLHVFVAGRTLAKVQAVANAINWAGGEATAVDSDATNEEDVVTLWRAAEAEGPVGLAIYNAGNNMPGGVEGMEADYFERCWRVCCFGAFVFAREAARHMSPREDGTLLFTGASASMRGRAGFAAFSSAKGALRNLAQSTAKELGPKGIHVGHVVIDGGIDGEKLHRGLPDYAAQRAQEGRLIDLGGIAEVYLGLHRQRRAAWTFEADVRTHNEPW